MTFFIFETRIRKDDIYTFEIEGCSPEMVSANKANSQKADLLETPLC